MKYLLTSRSPLLMHSERLADPTNPKTRELKKLSSTRPKTDEIFEQMRRVEWEGGLYMNERGPCLPEGNVLATLGDGARKSKLGKQVKAGVFGASTTFDLLYDGPREIEAMYADARFADYRSVGVNQARVMRCRPSFEVWSCEIDLVILEELISEEQVFDALTTAGAQCGVCDHRPQYGRFAVSRVG